MKTKKEKGLPPIKICPECFVALVASVRQCHECGHVFPKRGEAKKAREAEAAKMAEWAEAETELQMDRVTLDALNAVADEVHRDGVA